jgi:Plasmid pRiA4b ORF-3-like protein
MSKGRAADAAYQFRVWLRGISPMIWRRFLVRSASTIADLHYILQLLMGWTDTHLHTFVIHGKDYGIYHSGGMVFPDDPTTVSLHGFQLRVHERFLYTYDFSDNWEHEVRLEKVLPVDPRQKYPSCLGGARACPPEDCGGPAGFLALQDHFHLGYTMHRTVELLQELTRQGRKLEEEEREELSELRYWLTVDQFSRRLVNQRLRWYATDDPRWRDTLWQ